MIHKQDIMRCLPLLASALGRQYGVQVFVGGQNAFTDGQTIHLPSLPANYDNEYIQMVRGFIDHESGHIRETDFDLLRQKQLMPLQMTIFNALEDWRIEKCMGKRYAGCAHNFKYLIKKIFLEEAKEQRSQKSVFCVLDYILLTVRSWAVPELAMRAAAKASIIEKHFGGLCSALDAVLARAQQHCPDTAAAIAYAQEIYALLVQWAQNSTAQTQPNEADQGGYTENLHSGLNKNNNTGELQKPTESNEHNLETLIQASEDDLPRGIGEYIASRIRTQNEQSAQVTAVASIGKKSHTYLSPEIIQQVKTETASLGIRLQSLLQSETVQYCIHGRSGRLNTGRLYKLAIQDSLVFSRQDKKQSLNTAVHILLDSSASMRLNDTISLACKACYGVAHCLSRIQGISVGVTAFPAINAQTGIRDAVLPILKHGEALHTRFLFSAEGTTPMAEALWWVLQQMVALPEQRKIILILTDGEPNNCKSTKDVLQQAKNLGIEIYGIGIQSDSITLLLPKHSKEINTLTELAPAMFEVLQPALVNNLKERKI
jgi:cobaltochelatase CobT